MTALGVAYVISTNSANLAPICSSPRTALPDWCKLGMSPSTLEYAAGGATKATIPRRRATPPFHALGPAKSYIVLTDGGLAVDTQRHCPDMVIGLIPGLRAAGSAGRGGLTKARSSHRLGITSR